jgi:DNA-binding transcriptional LysR family regulator
MYKFNDLDWSSLRIILLTSRSRSLLEASHHVKLSESTLARRISHIEEQLNTVLFIRSSTGVELTSAGHKLVEYLSNAEENIINGTDEIRGYNNRVIGTLRLTSVPFLVNHFLTPYLGEFTKKHPMLSLEIVATLEDLSINKRETDIALRLACPHSEEGAITRRIGAVSYGVYIRKSLEAADMAQLPWIAYVPEWSHLPQAEWIAARVAEETQIQRPILVNDAEAALAGVRAGIGKSLLPCAIADDDPNLKYVKWSQKPPVREVWLLYRQDLKKLRRFAVVSEWILEVTKTLRQSTKP